MSPDTQQLLPGRFKPVARTDRPSNGLVPLPKPGEAPAETFSQLLKTFDASQPQRTASPNSSNPSLSATLASPMAAAPQPSATPARPYPSPAPAPAAPPAAAESAAKPSETAKPSTGARPQPRQEAAKHEAKAAHKAGHTPETKAAPQPKPAQGVDQDEAEQPADEVRLSELSDQPGIRGAGGAQAHVSLEAWQPDPLKSDAHMTSDARGETLAAAGLMRSDASASSSGAPVLSEEGQELGALPAGNARANGLGGPQGLRSPAKSERLDSKAAPISGLELKSAGAPAEAVSASIEASSGRRSDQPSLRGDAPSFDKMLAASASAQGASGPDKPSSSPVSEKPQVTLATPLYDSAFAPEMAARVSVLAADGVQEAQLHLNPAEMGPVAVSIVVEGQQAQISFHAEQADTRQVLEQSLPDLAAALRESGLTLSGGGVFQQAQDQGPGQQAPAPESRSARNPGREAEAQTPHSAGARSSPRVSRGVLDTYA